VLLGVHGAGRSAPSRNPPAKHLTFSFSARNNGILNLREKAPPSGVSRIAQTALPHIAYTNPGSAFHNFGSIFWGRREGLS
jgi:hypothetical protein